MLGAGIIVGILLESTYMNNLFRQFGVESEKAMHLLVVPYLTIKVTTWPLTAEYSRRLARTDAGLKYWRAEGGEAASCV